MNGRTFTSSFIVPTSSSPSMSRMSKPALAALCLCQLFHLNQPHFWHGQDEHLCDSHSSRDLERLLTMIHQRHMYFAAIVGVDRAGGVDHRDAILARQSTPRPNLCLVTFRQRH